MKTYRQLYEVLNSRYFELQDRYGKLCQDYTNLSKELINNRKQTEIPLYDTIVEVLKDITKNGGNYSKIKTLELLLYLGETIE